MLILALVWLVIMGVTWVLCMLDTVRLVRVVSLSKKTRPSFLAAALASVLVVGGAFSYGVVTLNSGRTLLGDIFSSRTVAKPVDGRYNIALLGSDAGKGRTGVRPDSLSVVSIDAKTGKAVVIGIPRNTQNAPFSENSPLRSIYPDGYNCGDDCLINAVYQLGQQHADLYPDDVDPGAQATKEALGGITGLEIQYFAMIDLQGFQQLIDALGGITLTSHVRVPISSKVNSTGRHDPPKGWIEPGENLHLDGYHALWYARAREFSSDYERMIRQRCVQEAMLKQMDPTNVLLNFQKIAKAAPDVVSTDVPQADIGTFVDLAGKTKGYKLDKLNLSPPVMTPVHPDYAAVHQTVKDAIDKSVEEAKGETQAAGMGGAQYYALGDSVPLAAGEQPEADAICEVP